MDKKTDLNIDKEIKRLKTQRPAILKCSFSMARRIKKESPMASLFDPTISTFLKNLKITPSDRIPDHIIFLCDEKGDTLRMVNLRERGGDPKKIILPGNLKTH